MSIRVGLMPDEVHQLWEQLREMESRITARIERVERDVTTRHEDNVRRLKHLEEIYWQSVGVGRFLHWIWIVLAAVGGWLLYWIKDHFK